ncbi:MAG: DUF4381 domain-containing protein [Gammaproteobacteria bacterium]|nr:DUF4381 domain-containing protein [Gammaproteobacteria bacterium]
MSTAPPVDPATIADALAQLRSYRLPEPVDWWPPAPGWWLLSVLVLGVVVAAAIWARRQRRLSAASRQAQHELAQLRRQLDVNGDTAGFVRQVSALLRRYALAQWPARDIAGLTGDDWLAFLDARGGHGEFTHGVGRHLADAPYRRTVDIPVQPLTELVERWIRHNRREAA